MYLACYSIESVILNLANGYHTRHMVFNMDYLLCCIIALKASRARCGKGSSDVYYLVKNLTDEAFVYTRMPCFAALYTRSP